VNITIIPTDLDGVRLIEGDVFTDHRGFFYESYSSRRFAQHGIDLTFVQDNHSRSVTNVVRGLHYQGPAGAQWRLVRCTVGEIFDVVVDLRVGSSTFGKWIGVRLSAQNKHQLLIPPPFAHGFAVVSGPAEVQYKCSGLHNAAAERALSWRDADLGIDWPLDGDPIVSAKDSQAPTLADYLANPDFPEGWDRSSA
jgi:dTDP-4-dehydrorhamnose 3,5-epimerase